jgi:uncharacterized protein (TIGR02646 family)
MRGVRKSRSPGDVGKHGHKKLSLQQAEADLAALLAASPSTEHSARARSAFTDLEKSKLRPILLQDQRHLCVYCEARVLDDPARPPTVEHWEPLGLAPSQALAWDNLYLSCTSDTSCDTKKHGERLVWDPEDDSLPPPCHFDYERCLGFGRGGEVYVKKSANLTAAQRRALELALDDREDGGRRRASILGLNSAALVQARKEAMDRERSRLDRKFGKGTVDAAARQAAANSLLAASQRESFVSVRVAWWTRQLGKDKP